MLIKLKMCISKFYSTCYYGLGNLLLKYEAKYAGENESGNNIYAFIRTFYADKVIRAQRLEVLQG